MPDPIRPTPTVDFRVIQLRKTNKFAAFRNGKLIGVYASAQLAIRYASQPRPK